MSSSPIAHRQPVLLLGPERACRRVSGALLLLGYRGIAVSDAGTALRALAGAGAVISGLVSGELPEPAAVLTELHASLATPLVWTLWGVRPEGDSASALRSAHVRFLLTEPFTEEDLRFVLDTSHQLADFDAPRVEPRVPTTLRARVITKTGERVAVLCNLSKHGAYLATPRPALRGGHIELEIPLPGHAIRTEADVLWNNVPGNLRRPNAPVGMGVRFRALAPESVAALGEYLEERAAAYRL